MTSENLHTAEICTPNEVEQPIQIPRQISDEPVPWMKFKYFQDMFIELALSDKKKPKTRRE